MARDKLSSDAAQRAAVYRLFDVDSTSPRGSAFGIGPRLALTCHHCVASVDTKLALILPSTNEGMQLVQVAEVLFPEDPLRNDIAILRMADDLPAWLPASSIEPPDEATLLGYGFPGSALRQAVVRIDVEPRGFQPAEYAQRYQLDVALVLSKDPAARGMSGGPIIESDSGAVVAMIVGGPDYDGRSIALPLCAVSTKERPWNTFNQAIAWNTAYTEQKGWAMNGKSATALCRKQVGDAIGRLTRRGTFDSKRYIDRPAFEKTVVDFLSRSEPALLLTGAANVGKTSALASLAERMSARTLLLDAFQMDRLRIELTELLQAQIAKVSVSADAETLPNLCNALRKNRNGELVVMVDGLNEAGASATEFRTWLSEAISQAEEQQFRLIVSCRSDYAKVAEIDKSKTVLFDLGLFTEREAHAAARAYGLEGLNPGEMEHHPLMFRIAARAANPLVVFEQGRYKSILGFVRDMVARSTGISAPQVDSLVLACCRVADHSGPDEDSVDRDFAANQMGGQPRLEALIEGGVFKAHENRIRFSFDEVAAGLRSPLDGDRIQLGVLWRKSFDDPVIANRLANSLVACESRGEHGRLSDHVESLLAALADVLTPEYFYRKENGVTSLVSKLADALPSARADIVGRIMDGFCETFVASARETSHYSLVYNLEISAAQLQVPWKAKAQLLMKLLPMLSDSGLRSKDLDRGGTSEILADAENPRTVVGALTRLILDHPGGMREFLVAHLDDRRRLMRNGKASGEATVGELIWSLLLLTSSLEPNELIELLISHPDSPAASRLLRHAATAHPVVAMECAINHLQHESTMVIVKDVIDSSLRSAGPGRAPRELVGKLKKYLREATLDTRLMAASLVRICEPDNLEAWDSLAYAVSIGSSSVSLRPVPGARRQEFISVLRARADQFALDEMIGEDDSMLQQQMSDLATEILRRPAFLNGQAGILAEHKAYKIDKHPIFAPWLKYILNVAIHPNSDVKENLRYLIDVVRDDLPSWHHQVWFALLAGSADDFFVCDLIRHAVGQHQYAKLERLIDLLSVAMKIKPEGTLEALSEIAWNAQRQAAVFSEDPDLPPPTLAALLGSVVGHIKLEPIPSWPISLHGCEPSEAFQAFVALYKSHKD